MSHEFKAGDIVVCVDGDGFLTKNGNLYNVEKVLNNGYLHINGGVWNKNKFAPVHAPKSLDNVIYQEDHDQRIDTAKKNDSGKPRMDIIHSVRGLDVVGSIFGEGSIEYGGDYQWRKSTNDQHYRMKLIGASLRHLHQYCIGNKFDDKSKKQHIAHAVCDLLMVLDMENS
jgi:Domain of unknown function (DUF5664)